VCGVLVWSDERWGSLTDLPDALLAVGYVEEARFGEDHVFYRRTTCR
jgi:hypothetical protein